MSNGFKPGNISARRASWAAVESASNSASRSTAFPPFRCGLPSSSMLRDSTEYERLVKSVSSARDKASPFHERDRGDPLLPDGSNAVLSSASALALRASRVARTALMEASSDRS